MQKHCKQKAAPQSVSLLNNTSLICLLLAFDSTLHLPVPVTELLLWKQ